MTGASRHLVALAERIAAAYVAHAAPRAVLLTGSAARGESDRYSDLDLIVYVDAPLDDRAAHLIAERLGVESATGSFELEGVECQVALTTVAATERELAEVLEELAPRSINHKIVEGIAGGVALHGPDLIEHWQARIADYPDGLARAVVAAHLQVFPLWGVRERLAARDAVLWTRQALVEGAQNVLGVLAGLNRLYYSTFQFKRARRFIGRMAVAPEALADRIEAMLVAEPDDAIAALERLVDEVVDLVELHMPEVDTAAVRRSLARRDHAWTPVEPPVGRAAGTVEPAEALPADEHGGTPGSTSGSVVIRPPRAGDGAGLARNFRDFEDYYVPLAPDLFRRGRDERAGEWLEAAALDAGSDDRFWRVAEVDGEVVGHVFAVVQRPDESAEWQVVTDMTRVRLFVNSLSVQRRHWRRGIGGRLMAAAEEWGRGRGATVALLDTWLGSPVSVAFYERRMGYRRRSVRFRKELGAGAT